MAGNRIRTTAGHPVARPVVCGVLGGLVVLACALQGTVRGSSTAAPPPPPRSATVDPSEYSRDGGPAAPLHLSGQPTQPWVTTAALVLAAVALAVLAGVLLGMWWRHRRGKPAPPGPTLPGAVVGTAVIDAAAATTVRPGAPAGSAPALELLPGDAVVRAWVALQEAAAGAGVPRRPAETPTEFTERLLDEVDAPRAVLDELRGLYLTARFSGRAVEPAEGERAVRAAHVLSSTWPAQDGTT